METPELVVDSRAELGEGPVWDSMEGRLLWLDIVGGRVHSLDPLTGSDESIEAVPYVSSITPRKGGGFVLTAGHAVLAWDGESSAVLAEIEEPDGNRFNDAKCDASGRLWAGTMDMNEASPAGSLYMVSPDRSVRRMLGGLTVSNGIDWSPDGKTMYHADSPTGNVYAYDFRMEDGMIGRSRVFASIPHSQGFPDGLTVDSDGMVWIAQWGGWCVSRWSAEGRLMETVKLPVSHVSSCTFGGRKMDTLFITSARYGLSGGELRREPHAGSLFSVVPGAVGRQPHEFDG